MYSTLDTLPEEFQGVEIKAGSYGLGAFATKEFAKDTYMGGKSFYSL